MNKTFNLLFFIKRINQHQQNRSIDGDQWIFTHRQKTYTSTRVSIITFSPQANFKI
ncbi:hypothetical protein QF044_000937 [Chryseobacterium sp. W4I1]|nr:hypothetical protein [Chryseobacterium sp. W4I1]